MKNWRKVVLLGAVIFAGIVGFNLFSIPFAIAQEGEVQGTIAQEEKAPEEYELKPMIVTAEKREENIQDVPVGITALSKMQIEDSGITSIKDLSLQIPNLNIVSWGTRRCSYIYNRGLGATNNAPAVGFYVDDVAHFEWGTFDIELFDIERIEVLRGPQGTLYGRNTLGGVINIITRKPENGTEGTASLTFGDYDRQDYKVAFRSPVIKDKLFFGLSGVKSMRNGYTENDFLDSDVDNRDGLSGRAHLRWLPSDTLDITLSANGEKQDDGAYPLGSLDEVRKDPHHVGYNFEGKHESDLYGSSLRIAYEAPRFKLTSITAGQSWDNKDSADQDLTPADFFTSFSDEKHNQLTQEIRLASPENAGSLKWLAGVYYFNDNFDRDLIIDFGADAVSAGFVPAIMKSVSFAEFDNKGYALFGQATYTIFDRFDLTAGLRYDYEKKEMDLKKFMEMGGMAVPGTEFEANPDEDFSEWLPKFVAAYRWLPNLMTYASVTKGYRSGGFNESFVDPSDISFDPEYSWNYELGFKSSWLDNRLIMNTAAFYIDWKDQQVIQLLPTGAETYFINAGESHSQGFEVEMIARPTTALDLIAGFGYTDSEFDEYEDPIAGTDYKGNQTPMTPRYTYNIAAQYRHPLTGSINLFGRVAVNGVGKSYWNDANTLKQDPYELVDARLGFETDHFEVYFWGKNVFDTEYEAIAFEFPGFSPLGQAGDPRTIGITFTGRF